MSYLFLSWDFMEGIAFIVGFTGTVLAGTAFFAWFAEKWHDGRNAALYGEAPLAVFSEVGADEDGDPVWAMLPEDNPQYDPTYGENELLSTWQVVEVEKEENGEVRRDADGRPIYRIRKEVVKDAGRQSSIELEVL